MLFAATFACIIALIAQASASDGFVVALQQSPTAPEVAVTAQIEHADQQAVDSLGITVKQMINAAIGSELSGSAAVSLASPPLAMQFSPSIQGSTGIQMSVLGYPSDLLASHLTLVNGSLPQPIGSEMQIVLTQQTAQIVHAHPGSTYYLVTSHGSAIPIVVSGIVTTSSVQPDIWGANNPDPLGTANGTNISGIANSQQFLSLFTPQFASSGPHSAIDNTDQTVVSWLFHLAPTSITTQNISDVVSKLNTLQNTIPGTLSSDPAVVSSSVGGDATTILESNEQLFASFLGPLLAFGSALLIVILIFLSLIIELMVESEELSISLMRSRGASRAQILLSFGMPLVAIAVIMLIVAPIAALLATQYLIHARYPELAQIYQANFQTIPGRQGEPPGQVLSNILIDVRSLLWLVGTTIGLTVLSGILALLRASRQTILTVRRESGRSQRKPLWMRMYLDVLLGIFSLIMYGILLKIASQITDENARLSLLMPALIAFVCSSIALIGLLTRIIPFVLRIGIWFARRGNGVPGLYALSHMSQRAKRSAQLVILIAQSIALMIFMLIELGTQQQYGISMAKFDTGADFSGPMSAIVAPGTEAMQQVTQEYQQVPGISTASIGSIVTGTSNYQAVLITAINPDSYAKTISWSTLYSHNSLQSLMLRLQDQRSQALASGIIPAIIDQSVAQKLDLSQGAGFTLTPQSNHEGTLRFQIAGIVTALPGIHQPTEGQPLAGNMLVDYATLAAIMPKATGTDLTPNYVWVRITSGANAYEQAVQALSQGNTKLSAIYDLRKEIQQQSVEPFWTALQSVLQLGVVITIVLMMIGYMASCILSIQFQRLSFGVLRSLGLSQQQLLRVIGYEQGIISTLSLGIGSVTGGLFVWVMMPLIAHTPSLLIPVLQNLTPLPLHIIIPWNVFLFGFLAAFWGWAAFFFFLTQAQATRKDELVRVLRYNED